MDGAEVGVLEETDEVRLGSFLKRQDGVALEAEIGLQHTGLCVGVRFGQRRLTRTRVKRSRRRERRAGKGVANFFGTGAHLEVLSDLADEALEGELADQQLGGLLVLPVALKGSRGDGVSDGNTEDLA